MKDETPPEVNIVPQVQPETSFLNKTAEIENRIAKRAYELFASRGFTDGHDLDDWFSAESELFGQTAVKVTENDKAVTVQAGLPGFTEKEVEIRVEPYRLFISGTHEEKSENKKKGETVYSESSSHVFRSIALPAQVDPDKVKTSLSKGELEITLPKKAIGKEAPIEPKAA